MEVGNRPYQAYTGQRTADFQPGFDAALGQLDPTKANAASDQASAALGNLQPGIGMPDYTAGTVNPLQFDQAQVDKYMSPYVNNVIAANLAQLDQRFARDSIGRSSLAAKAGAYGDYGHRVMDQVAIGDNNRLAQEAIYGGLSDAYNRATGMFESARGAQMQADEMNIGDRQFAANYGLQRQDQGFNQGVAQAQGYNTLANDIAQRNLALSDATAADANRRMAYQQAGLDAQYSDYKAGQLWDQQQLSWLTGILYGEPSTVNQTYDTTYSSPLAQGLGLAATATGLYNQGKS